MYMLVLTALKYVKQKLIKLKKEWDKFAITVGDFNSPFTVMDRMSKQKHY